MNNNIDNRYPHLQPQQLSNILNNLGPDNRTQVLHTALQIIHGNGSDKSDGSDGIDWVDGFGVFDWFERESAPKTK